MTNQLFILFYFIILACLICSISTKGEIMTDAFRIIVNHSFKKSFYGKRRKTINILTAFFISYKNSVKIFLK